MTDVDGRCKPGALDGRETVKELREGPLKLIPHLQAVGVKKRFPLLLVCELAPNVVAPQLAH